MPVLVRQATKQEARYTPAGGRERCADCRFFVSPNDCQRIIGPVSPLGWCKYFSQQAVAASRRPGGFVGGGGVAGIGDTALDISFLNVTTLDSRITFARASIGTYFDATGTMQTAPANAPRFDYDPVTLAPRGLLIEELRTNLLLNSATLSTQSVTTTATATTLSFYGTGSITLSGTSTGTTNGTGTNTRVSTTFTPTAGTLTLTVTGSVTSAQLEAGAFPTSYIPTTSGALSRQPDIATLASGAWRNAAAETYAAEFLMLTTQNTTNPRIISSATSQISVMAQMASRQIQMWDGVGAFNTTNSFALGTPVKAAAAWSSPTGTLCVNAGPVATAAGLTAGFGAITTFRFLGDTAPTDQSNGYIRRFRYWPRVLSYGELGQVTT